jgi:hypothetical protein
VRVNRDMLEMTSEGTQHWRLAATPLLARADEVIE